MDDDAIAFAKHPLTLEECVYLIGNMPDTVLGWEHGIFVDAPLEYPAMRILQTIRTNFYILSQWLEYYELKKSYLAYELKSTYKKHYKPLAEASLARLKLIQEVCLHTKWTGTIPSVLHWWVATEVEHAQVVLRRSGLIGGTFQPIGKVEAYRNVVSLCRGLENVERVKLTEISDPTPISALEGIAVHIAQEDVKFRNTCWRDYLRINKRCSRALRDSPLVPVFLPMHGKFVRQAGRGKSLKPKKLCEVNSQSVT